VASLALPWFAPPEILSLKVATFKGSRSVQPFSIVEPDDNRDGLIVLAGFAAIAVHEVEYEA
jgi:hypothetical protein